jgi:hypothetical protein
VDDIPTADSLKECGCGPGSDEVRKLSGLGDAQRSIIVVPEAAPARVPLTVATSVQAPIQRAPMPLRRRKPRSKGSGAYCVFSHKGNVVHCYHKQDTAKRVAKAFGARTGTKFTVKSR